MGNVGWVWDDVLFYFKKLENYECGFNEFYGVGGFFNVLEVMEIYLVSDVVIEVGI